MDTNKFLEEQVGPVAQDIGAKFLEPLPPVTNIRRYRYRPGDRIIVRINERISQDVAHRVQEVVANTLAMPRIEDVLVLGSGSDIKVMRNTSVSET